jgi:glutamine amidotransferase-like uncharacterized protein
MPKLIFTRNVNDPSLIARTTRETLEKLFPEETITYSSSLKVEDEAKHSDSRYTLVIPGDNLYMLHGAMKASGARENCIEEVDQGAHFIGFCAGAFYGSEKTIANKDGRNTYFRFNMDKVEDAGFLEDFSLGMIEGTTAIGPVLPYEDAPWESGKFSSHCVKVIDAEKSFNSMYVEGPIFLNKDLTGLYSNKQCVVANYDLDYSPEIEIIKEMKTHILSGKSIFPAVLHDEVKGSHRYLIGPHTELASSARTFLPAFERAFCPRYLSAMEEADKNKLLTESEENENQAFLKRTLTFRRGS